VKVASGFVAPGFEGVKEEFERNFSERGDVGAAFAVVGEEGTLVDLWGGLSDGQTRKPWSRDTLQLVFSGSKGLVATCILILLERGELELDAPVASYWPEFAAAGKESVTVAELLSHRARLPGIHEPLQVSDLTDDVRLAAILAAQAPDPDPRAESSYHALTFGWLCGELIRRVDGRSVGRFFAEEVASPLELDLWIGLPESEEDRVSTLVFAPDWAFEPEYEDDELAADPFLASTENPRELSKGAMPWNLPAFHRAEIPAINAIGTARSLARLYCCLACGGCLGGVRLLKPETVELGRRELSRFVDPIGEVPRAYGVGFEIQTGEGHLGPPQAAFGHSGMGGSIHVAWPRQRLGLSYAMNELRNSPAAGDPRYTRLFAAVWAAIGEAGES